MEKPRLIDLANWPRRQLFEHYSQAAPCTYSITVELDVTAFAAALRHSPRKTYIAQIWAIAAVVNKHEEFRMCISATGQPAIWPTVHPYFTVFNAERETFASVWAPYDADFASFHEVATPLLAEYSTSTNLFPQGEPPANTFDVSSLPWASFTAFNLNLKDGWTHLAPIFTLGRYVERNNQVLLPLAVQVHHAAADGFHTTRFVNELQALVSDPSWLS